MERKTPIPGRSIFTTQTASYLLIILVITATFSLFFFSTAKDHLEREVGQKLQDIAGIAAKNAPFERLDLIKPGDDEARMVLRLKEKLGEIKEATGVSNIVVFRPDRALLIDLRPDRPIGTALDPGQFDTGFLSALEQGAPVSTGSYRLANGELFVSAYAPVLDPDGHLFAIIAVDAGTKEVEVIEHLRSRLYWVAGIGIIFAFVLALLLARRLTRPIQHMALTAERLGKGDYQARVPIPSTAELRTLAESINEMAAQVQRRDAQLKELSAGVAHEIRNPLNSIKLLITLLGEELQERQDGAPPETLATLHYEIGKLNRFLTEFLTYSRPITLIRDKASPAELARNAAEMANAEAGEKGVTIEVSIEPDLPDLHVDRDRLEQSLLNIVLNAVQACEPNGRVELSVKRIADGETVEFTSTDNGPGVPADALTELFQPFFTTKETGTGLGLSNTERIVISHGGTISAENLPAGGARFAIRLPINGTVPKED
jgi:signal transduction histidine kinase